MPQRTPRPRHEARAEAQPEPVARQVDLLDRPESVQIEYPQDRDQPPRVRVTVTEHLNGRIIDRRDAHPYPMPPALARQLEAWAIEAANAPAPEPEAPDVPR